MRCLHEGKSLVLGICGEDGKLGGEPAVVHFEDGFYHVGDVLGAELGGVFFLLEAGNFGETGEDFAGIDEHDADVVFAELVSPAFRHPAERELARVVRRASCRALQSGG